MSRRKSRGFFAVVLRTRFNFQDGEMCTEQEQVCNLGENIYFHYSLGTVILAYITVRRIIYTRGKYSKYSPHITF
jgi:hypothetical protein